jgi:hypothetical protein
MSKTAYQYDSAGFYTGTTEADESPLEPGVFLLPARCTFTVPPTNIPDSQWPRWNGASWNLINKPIATEISAADKLKAFLSQNPDVAALINT